MRTKTNRLYYDDAYLSFFESSVCEKRLENGKIFIALVESAFYPTSGGQPFDTGVIYNRGNILRVSGVEVDEDGVVWHEVDKDIELGTPVCCAIDFERRFDHMQQHSGEHILAGCVYSMFSGTTIGLHLGRDDSTIDIDMPDGRTRISDMEKNELEEMANRRIQENAPVKCFFPSEEELKYLPLRKRPSVEKNVRVVQAGDFEMVPCGGTHVKNTGELGLIKIISIHPAKDKMRICFVVGARAIKYIQACHESLTRSANSLSCGLYDLPFGIESLKAELQNEKLKNKQLLDKLSIEYYKGLCALKKSVCGKSIVSAALDLDMRGLVKLAGEIIKEENSCAILQSSEDFSFVIACSFDEDLNELIGGLAKGGGKAGFIQGKADRLITDEIEKRLVLKITGRNREKERI